MTTAVPCTACHRPVRLHPVYDGGGDVFGESCARDRGLTGGRRPRPARPVRVDDPEQPSLLELLDEEEDEINEGVIVVRKIPTLFVRDEQDMRYVTREVHPDCKWVIDGEGMATRKFDGACVALLYTDGQQVLTEPPTSGPSLDVVELRWFARREVKPGKQAPEGYVPVEHDEVTGKTVGWEPIEQSSFAKFHAEVLARCDDDDGWGDGGTFELVGPKINGNPEGLSEHLLLLHALADPVDAPRDYDGLAAFLVDFPGEGIVWHHPDGRMAKLKRRDFPRDGAR